MHSNDQHHLGLSRRNFLGNSVSITARRDADLPGQADCARDINW